MSELDRKCTECDWLGNIEDAHYAGNAIYECPECSGETEQHEDGDNFSDEYI